MSQPQAHHLVSPSNEIAHQCSASPFLQREVDERNSYLQHKYSQASGVNSNPELLKLLKENKAMAEKGTTLHAIRDSFFTGEIESIEEGLALVEDREYMGESLEYISRALQDNADRIQTAMKEADRSGSEVRIENLGTGSGGWLDTWWLKSTDLFIDDLKTGRIEVHANCNQLKRYACGVLDILGWQSGIVEVHLSISAILFPSSTYTLHINELWQWRQQNLSLIMDSIYAIHKERTAGDHCRWCRAKGVNCNEYTKQVDVVVSTSSKIDPEALLDASNDELESQIRKLDSLKGIQEALKMELGIRHALNEYEPKRLILKKGRKFSRYSPDSEQAVRELTVDPDYLLLRSKRLLPVSKLKKLIDLPKGYTTKQGVEPIAHLVDDVSVLYQPDKYKTKNSLRTLFKHLPSALVAIDKGDMLALRKVINNDLLYAPVSPAVLRKMVEPELVSGFIIDDQYGDSFAVVPESK